MNIIELQMIQQNLSLKTSRASCHEQNDAEINNKAIEGDL
jgi:hypothetical protein